MEYNDILKEIEYEIEAIPDVELLDSEQTSRELVFVVQEQTDWENDVTEGIEEALLNLGLSVVYDFSFLKKEVGRPHNVINRWGEVLKMANRKLVELLIEEDQDAFGVEAISLVKFPAIEENWIAFSKDKKSRVLSLASIDEDKRTLIGAALIPDKNIPRYDELSDEEYDVFFSQDTVKLASELFLKTNRTNEHTLEHEQKVDGVSVVESWIVSDPEMDKAKHFGMEMPVGTWMVRVHVGNDEMWEAVKEGSIRGFSIEGYFVDSVQEMSTKVEKGSVKKTLSRMWNFLKRKFYVEIPLDNGTILATEDDALTPGSKVFTLDDEGMPIELNNGKFKTGGGIELEVFDGVLIEYDGEVKAIEDEVEEMEKVELDEMKVKYYKALLKGRMKDYLGNSTKLSILKKIN